MTTDWESIVAILNRHQPAVRLKWDGDDEPGHWGTWVIIPVPGYLETGSTGPVPFANIEWLEIDVSRTAQLGRLVPWRNWHEKIDSINAELASPLAFDGSLARIQST